MIGHEIVATLRQARIDQGMRQVDLAMVTGHHQSCISRWERGDDVVSIYAACDMAEALGLGIIIRKKESAA